MNVDINALHKVGDIKEIIRTNGWKEFKIDFMESIKKENIEIYKKKIIAKLHPPVKYIALRYKRAE